MVHSTLVEKTTYAVDLTAGAVLDVLTPLILDLSRDLSDRERYRRLLRSLLTLFPGDAAALLRLEGDTLVPLAIDGLSSDTLGRRFRVGDHPRFEQLLSRPEPTRFAADSDLPDPYDGLVQGMAGHLEVHDCLGCRCSFAVSLGGCSRSMHSTPHGSTPSTWRRCGRSSALPLRP